MMKKGPDLFQILVYYVKFPVYCGTTQKFTSAILHYLQEIKKSMWSIYWILMFIFYYFWKKIYQNCIKWRNSHHVDLLCHGPLNTCKLNLLNCYFHQTSIEIKILKNKFSSEGSQVFFYSSMLRVKGSST
jgi:hypothetical protein